MGLEPTSPFFLRHPVFPEKGNLSAVIHVATTLQQQKYGNKISSIISEQIFRKYKL